MQNNLGKYLKQRRRLKMVTLRDVEEATNISNAYLSQIETGKVLKPSPNKLFSIADFLGVPYEKLMMLAGHIPTFTDRDLSKCGAFIDFPEITEEEEKQLLDYLDFIRFKNAKN